MKLAAIYNVYDSEELLQGSINQIRSEVDVVIAVVQTLSNWGEVYEGGQIECNRLFELGLIDYVIQFTPKIQREMLNGCHNETRKRIQGFELAKQLGCTHFLFMDCDEYYVNHEFAEAKKVAIKHDATCLHIQDYCKYPTLAKRELEGYYVPFIHKIQTTEKIGFCKYPYYCDPTRVTNHTTSYLFPSNEIVMHHFTNIRKDIERKYRNSSAQMNFDLTTMLQTFAQIELIETPICKFVPNQFGIDESFCQNI